MTVLDRRFSCLHCVNTLPFKKFGTRYILLFRFSPQPLPHAVARRTRVHCLTVKRITESATDLQVRLAVIREKFIDGDVRAVDDSTGVVGGRSK